MIDAQIALIITDDNTSGNGRTRPSPASGSIRSQKGTPVSIDPKPTNRVTIGKGSVVGQVNDIIAKAIQQQASDIHVEPYEHELRCRYRLGRGTPSRRRSTPSSERQRPRRLQGPSPQGRLTPPCGCWNISPVKRAARHQGRGRHPEPT